jgi:hypothetical protein
MAYAALSDVQGLIAKFPIGTTTKPDVTQAETIITQVSAEIDAVIAGQGYAVPVTLPVWFLDALKLLNAYGAAASVLRSMFPDRVGGDENAAAMEAYYAGQYNRGLRRLATGEGIPPGMVAGSAQVTPSTYFTRNPDEEEDLGDIAEPFFKRNTVF